MAKIIKMKDILSEGKRGEYASIYNMKEEMAEGKFDPKNLNIREQ